MKRISSSLKEWNDAFVNALGAALAALLAISTAIAAFFIARNV